MKVVKKTFLDKWFETEIHESVIEPNMPIIDSHHHLWDISLSKTHSKFKQKVYLYDDFLRDINKSGHNIIDTVYVQCRYHYKNNVSEEYKCIGETEFADNIAKTSIINKQSNINLCSAIISYTDINLTNNFGNVIEAHKRTSKNFRGIRCPIPDKFNDDNLNNFKYLEKQCLLYETYSSNLSNLEKVLYLASLNPDLKIIINHFGGIIKNDNIKIWKNYIKSLSNQKNIYIKIGGFQQFAQTWNDLFSLNYSKPPINSDQLLIYLTPIAKYIISYFDTNRCMFESNYPVDRECISYKILWNTFKKYCIISSCNLTDKKNLFFNTAKNIYKIS